MHRAPDVVMIVVLPMKTSPVLGRVAVKFHDPTGIRTKLGTCADLVVRQTVEVPDDGGTVLGTLSARVAAVLHPRPSRHCRGGELKSDHTQHWALNT